MSPPLHGGTAPHASRSADVQTQPTLFSLSVAALLALPARLCNPPLAVGKVRSCSVTPIFKVKLEDVLDRKHLPPLGLKDFEEWLLFVEQSPENLYFLLWLREYAARYNRWAVESKHRASPPSPTQTNKSYRVAWPTSRTSPALSLFYARAKQTFFTPNSDYELVDVPSDLLAPFHTTNLGSPHPDPEMFNDVAMVVQQMLKQSLHRFVLASYHNVGSSRAICGMVAGTFISVLGAVPPILVNFIDARSRWLRLLAIPGLWLGLTILIGSLHGVCLMVYIFGDVRQLRKFELQRPPISRPKNLRSHSLADEGHRFASGPLANGPVQSSLTTRPLTGPPRITITIPQRAVTSPLRSTAHTIPQRKHKDRRVRSQAHPSKRGSVSTPSLSFSATATTTSVFTTPDSLHEATAEVTSVDIEVLEEGSEEEAEENSEEDDEDNGIYVSPAYRPEDEDLDFGMGYNYGSSPSASETERTAAPASASSVLLPPHSIMAGTSAATATGMHVVLAAGPPSPISPISEKDVGTSRGLQGAAAAESTRTASFIHPYQESSGSDYSQSSKARGRGRRWSESTSRSIAVSSAVASLEPVSRASSTPSPSRAQPLSAFDFDALPVRGSPRERAYTTQSDVVSPPPQAVFTGRDIHFTEMITSHIPVSRSFNSPITPLRFSYPSPDDLNIDLERAIVPSMQHNAKRKNLLSILGLRWPRTSTRTPMGSTSMSTSTLNVSSGDGVWGAITRVVGYKQEKCARCVTEKVLRGSGVTFDAGTGQLVPVHLEHEHGGMMEEDDMEDEDYDMEDGDGEESQPNTPKDADMEKMRFRRSMAQYAATRRARTHGHNVHDMEDDATHGAGCPPHHHHQSSSSRPCPRCVQHNTNHDQSPSNAPGHPSTSTTHPRPNTNQKPYYSRVPIFGPVTRVHSPVVSRAQWEVMVRSFVFAGVLSWVVVGGLVALPEVKMAVMAQV